MQMAQQDLGAVLKSEPGNAEATRLLEELQRTREAQKAADRQLASGMIATGQQHDRHRSAAAQA